MNEAYTHNDAVCNALQPLLSDYVDGTLSARHTFEVERHMAACSSCARQVRQLEATVNLLHGSERHDTADDFMARLHARLDDVEPEPAHRASLQWLRSVLEGVRGALRTRSVPALGMAAAGLIGVLLLTRPLQAPTVAPLLPSRAAAPSPHVRRALDQQVAATAGDPLGDVAAENLAVQGATETDSNSGGTSLE